MKVCTTCNESKDESEFFKASRLKTGLASACKVCCNIYHVTSRSKKKDHYDNVRKARECLNKAKFDAWKANQACFCCPENDIDCLDLHHLDPTKKDVAISNVVRSWSWKRLVTEIEKCIVVCANCHRKIHKGKIVLEAVDIKKLTLEDVHVFGV